MGEPKGKDEERILTRHAQGKQAVNISRHEDEVAKLGRVVRRRGYADC